jgi:hypothetical protein
MQLRLFDTCVEPAVFLKLCSTTDLREAYVEELQRCTGHAGISYYEQAQQHTRLCCQDIDNVLSTIDFNRVFPDDAVVNRTELTVAWRTLGTLLSECRASDPMLFGDAFQEKARTWWKKLMDPDKRLPYSYVNMTLYAHVILNHCGGWMSPPTGMYRWSLNSGEASNQKEETLWRSKSTRDGLGQDSVRSIMLAEMRQQQLDMLGLIKH